MINAIKCNMNRITTSTTSPRSNNDILPNFYSSGPICNGTILIILPFFVIRKINSINNIPTHDRIKNTW